MNCEGTVHLTTHTGPDASLSSNGIASRFHVYSREPEWDAMAIVVQENMTQLKVVSHTRMRRKLKCPGSGYRLADFFSQPCIMPAIWDVGTNVCAGDSSSTARTFTEEYG